MIDKLESLSHTSWCMSARMSAQPLRSASRMASVSEEMSSRSCELLSRLHA